MAAGLQDQLRNLFSCISSDDPVVGGRNAHNIVGDIGHKCLQDVTEKDIGEKAWKNISVHASEMPT